MGGRQRLRRKEKVTKKLDRDHVKGGGEKKDRKWSKWMGGEVYGNKEICRQEPTVLLKRQPEKGQERKIGLRKLRSLFYPFPFSSSS